MDSAQLEVNKAVFPQQKSIPLSKMPSFSTPPSVNTKKSPVPPSPELAPPKKSTKPKKLPTDSKELSTDSLETKAKNPCSPSFDQQKPLCFEDNPPPLPCKGPCLPTIAPIVYLDREITDSSIDPQRFNWDTVEQKVTRNSEQYPINFETLRTFLTTSKDQANDMWRTFEDYRGLSTMLYDIWNHMPKSDQLQRRLREFKHRANQSSPRIKHTQSFPR